MSFRWVNTGDKSIPEYKWEYKEQSDTPSSSFGKSPYYNWGQEPDSKGAPKWVNRG